MKRFEDYLVEAARDEAARRASDRSREKRRRTREEQRQRSRTKLAFMTSVVLWAMLILAVLTVGARSEEPDTDAVEGPAVSVSLEETVQEDYENEKIEAALVESGYFRDDIPMDYDTQACLRAACEESGVEYEVMLGLIDRETGFQNINGDGGDSIGYCQIQPKWWSGLMTELGVNDLTRSLDNFRTGCAILSGLTEKYGSLEYALTAYNTGKPGKSEYADDVLQRIEKWRRN